MIPIIPPIIALRALAIIKIVLAGEIRWVIIIKGASFCQVAKRMHIGHGRLDITEGNQKCIGAAPNLVRIPKVKRIMEAIGDEVESGLKNIVI